MSGSYRGLHIGCPVIGGIVLADLLDVVHRLVRDADKVPQVGTVFRHKGDTDARSTLDLLTLDDVRLKSGLNQTLGNMFRTIDAHARQNDGKFVATEPCQNILGSQAKFQAVAKGL